MDEFVDIVDQDGRLSGDICLKSEAHKKGLWHPCVNIWLYNLKGDVLIQKRVADKDTFPDLWDISVAGHIGAGEIPLEAAQRELSEELGLEISIEKLQGIGTYLSDHKHHDELIDREFHYVYIVEFEGSIMDLRLQEEEVSEIKMIPLAEVIEVWTADDMNERYVPYTLTYLQMVFKAIEKRIQNAK